MEEHTSQQLTFVEKRRGDTLVNAVLGAVVSILLSFTGIGVILGGGVAGYLQGQGGGAGAKVGALSGLVTAIPAFLFVALLAGGIGAAGLGAGDGGLGAIFGGFVLFVLVVVVAVAVAMSALGGFVGGMIADRGDARSARQYDQGWDDNEYEADVRN